MAGLLCGLGDLRVRPKPLNVGPGAALLARDGKRRCYKLL